MYVCYVVCARLVNNMWEILFLFCSTRKLFRQVSPKFLVLSHKGEAFLPFPRLILLLISGKEWLGAPGA